MIAVAGVATAVTTYHDLADTDTAARRSSTSFADGTACAASRRNYGILIEPATQQVLAATRRTSAEVEARVRSLRSLATRRPAVHSYLALVTNPSPAVGNLINHPTWVVEATGFSLGWGGMAYGRKSSQLPVRLTHGQFFVDDATGKDLFSLACP
jgi:hypothetical protein